MGLSVHPERIAPGRDEAEAEPLSAEEAIRIVLGIPRKAGHAENQEERFTVCDVCGQIFDLDNLKQLAHHGSHDHQPRLEGEAD